MSTEDTTTDAQDDTDVGENDSAPSQPETFPSPSLGGAVEPLAARSAETERAANTGDVATESVAEPTASVPEMNESGSVTESQRDPASTGVDLDDSEPGEVVPDPAAMGRRWGLALTSIVVALASFVGPIRYSGLWDPHELQVAEFGRRIAHTLMGGVDLALVGSNNLVPSLAELGRGELPFTSVAVGFRLFGLSEWAGRLPLAIWALAGALAAYYLLSRLADRVAGPFAVLVLATTPLYFLQARTMLGDVVTMASLSIAVTGLGISIFNRDAERRSTVSALAWFLLGCLGLVGGFSCRGALIGVAAPALGVGLAWASTLGHHFRTRDLVRDGLAAVTLLCGVVAVVLGARAVLSGTPDEYSMLVGATIDLKPKLTHDSMLHRMGHGLYPWSAVLPFVIGLSLKAPVGVEGGAYEREQNLRVVLLLVAGLAVGLQSLIAPYVGELPFCGVVALACLAGVVFRDFERGSPAVPAVAMGVFALGILFYTDFKNFPAKAFSGFGVPDGSVPESFKEQGTKIIKYGTVLFAGLFGLCTMERSGRRWAAEHASDGSWLSRTRRALSSTDFWRAMGFRKDGYLQWPVAVRRLYDGNLFFAVNSLLLGLVALPVVVRGFGKWHHIKQFSNLSSQQLTAANWAWAGFVVLLLGPLLVLTLRNVVRTFFQVVPLSRSEIAAGSVAAFGLTFSLGYYPALASQISPREVYDSFQSMRGEGEELAMIGGTPGSARYYAGGEVTLFSGTGEAYAWLNESDARRWLVVREGELAKLNSLYRRQSKPARNVPVLNARSSEILLVSNQLTPGVKNQNPFEDWVHSEPTHVAHPLDVNLGNKLDVQGWSVRGLDGVAVDSVVPGREYDFVIHYKVVARINGTWKTFIHIDGFQRRFNGDHDTLGGKYPFNLWRKGDYISDVYRFKLEPNFSAGQYTVLFGLFSGSKRLEVKRGKHGENRINGGKLTVE